MSDRGDVKFNVDLATGQITITTRPPFGLPTSGSSATMSVMDFLDIAADVIKGTNAATRDALTRMRNGQLPGSGAHVEVKE